MRCNSVLINKLRDPAETSALIWLFVAGIPVYIFIASFVIGTFGGGLFFIGLIMLSRFLAELFAAAYIKSNAIEVSQHQLPEVYAAVQTCCQRLEIPEPPTVYVMQENIWNAFAMRMAYKRVVVLLSGAVDSLLLKGDMQQVTWLVGHEIGHHAAGHLDFLRELASCGGWLIWVLLWYKRRCELTCDRIGLYCTSDLPAALKAVANMSVGAQLADKVDIDRAIEQWHRHRHEVYVRYRTIYSTHPPTLWRMEELKKVGAQMGLASAPVTYPPPPAAGQP